MKQPGLTPGDAVPEKTTALAQAVQQEAARAALNERIKADPALLAEGWERRFVADGRRAQEAVELYTALGFEARALPVRPEEISEECEDCRLIAALNFQTVYTRRR